MPTKYGKLYAKDSSGNIVQIIPEAQTIEEYQGANASAAGTPGLVPGALASQKDMFLKGDGTWQGAVTIDTEQTITGLKTVDKNIIGTVQTLSGSQIDVTSASFFKKTVSANTIFTFVNAPAGKTTVFTLIIENRNGYEITFPNNVNWIPYAPDTEIESGMFTFVTTDGGTTWDCNLGADAISASFIDNLGIATAATSASLFILPSTPSTTNGAMWATFGTGVDEFVLPSSQPSTADGAIWME